MATNMTPKTFTLGQKTQWKKHLEEHGFVVIRNAITKKEAEKTKKLFGADIKKIAPGFDINNPKTFTGNNLPIVMGKGSATHYGVGQGDALWNARLNSKTKKAFSLIYGTDDLAVALDGAALVVSHKQQSPGWEHQDQNPADTRVSVQGILNLLPCGEHDAGFICVPGSHRTYTPPKEQMDKLKSYTDWLLLPEDSPVKRDTVKLITPERCLVLFHSKTVHANKPMSKPAPPGLNRLSFYITFGPKSRQTAEIVQRRKEGYMKGETTSHWIDRHEVKKLPFHLISKFRNAGFTPLKPRLTADGEIPAERAALL